MVQVHSNKGGITVVKYFLGTLLLGTICIFPVSSMAGVNVSVGISLPPLITFSAPPEVIVIPNTYVYAVPDVGVDIFFYNGWWWRPWEGRWYRSRHYNSGWSHYQRVPNFYNKVPTGWRNNYRDRRWDGHQWNYQRIPQRQVQQNWRTWEKNRHWERNNSWGVQRPKYQSQSRKVQKQYSPPQHQAPQKYKSDHGKSGKGGGERRDRK
jgi:hypothetical protein